MNEAVAGYCCRGRLFFLRPFPRAVCAKAPDVDGVIEGDDGRVEVGLPSGHVRWRRRRQRAPGLALVFDASRATCFVFALDAFR